MYKHIIISTFIFISISASAQGAYNVEKIWGIKFKLPKECIGNPKGNKTHYWVESSTQKEFDFELILHKTTTKSHDKKIERVLSEIPDELISQEQKERLNDSDAWIHTLRNHIEVSYVEVENKYWTLFFSFEWEKSAYVGWICVRNKQWKVIAQSVFQSFQPAN